MKILLDVPDKRAEFVLELLSNLSYIKTEKIQPAKTSLKSEILDAIREVKLAKIGKLKLQTASELLDEL